MKDTDTQPGTTDVMTILRDPNWTHPPRHLLLSAADEIERLRSVIVGCEIALNRDDDVSAVRRLLVKERHANGY